MGEHSLKNIAGPVRAYRVLVDGAGRSTTLNTDAARSQKPSIAVLPFANMSGDPEQEYFSDGASDDIVTDMSRLSSLYVIARNSSFTYKGRVVKVQEVARDLSVRYVLEGSVRKAGNRVLAACLALIGGQKAA